MPLDNLRPNIQGLQISQEMRPAELFQNRTLRPVIKMKHDLFIVYLRDYLISKKQPLSNLSIEKGIAYIESVFQNDRNLRSELRGIVLGHFTMEEYVQYVDIKNEINKRIISIIKKRMVDHIDILRQ